MGNQRVPSQSSDGETGNWEFPEKPLLPSPPQTDRLWPAIVSSQSGCLQHDIFGHIARIRCVITTDIIYIFQQYKNYLKILVVD